MNINFDSNAEERKKINFILPQKVIKMIDELVEMKYESKPSLVVKKAIEHEYQNSQAAINAISFLESQQSIAQNTNPNKELNVDINLFLELLDNSVKNEYQKATSLDLSKLNHEQYSMVSLALLISTPNTNFNQEPLQAIRNEFLARLIKGVISFLNGNYL